MPNSNLDPKTKKKAVPSIHLAWYDSSYLIWGILALAFILRAALLWIGVAHITRAFQPDSQGYIDPAIKLISTGFYPIDSAYRTPIYPLFIAIIYWILGQNPLMIIGAQVIIGTLTVWLSYHLGVKILSKPVALLGAFLLAISVESITSVFYILTETLFTFLFLAGLISWVNGCRKNSKLWLACAGILMGLSALCRPLAVYFPLFLALGLLINKGLTWKRRIVQAAVFIFLFLLSLAPWIIRNIYIVGSPTISTISSYNMLFYEAASVEANIRGVSETQVRDEFTDLVNQTLVERGWTNNEGNRSRVDSLLADQIILAHPVRFLYIHLKGDLNGFLPDVTSVTEILGATIGSKGTLSVLNQYGILAAIRNYFGGKTWLLELLLPLIILLALVYLFAVDGIVEIIHHHNWISLLLLVIPVFYFLFLPGPASLPRFRVPVMPYISLLAGFGLRMAWNYFEGWRKKKSGLNASD